MSYSDINEPIKMAAVFEGGTVSPARFRWRGCTKRIREVTGRWKTRVGEDTLHYIALIGEDGVYYEVSFSTKTLVWRLERLEAE